jgi:hypothetical protein
VLPDVGTGQAPDELPVEPEGEPRHDPPVPVPLVGIGGAGPPGPPQVVPLVPLAGLGIGGGGVADPVVVGGVGMGRGEPVDGAVVWPPFAPGDSAALTHGCPHAEHSSLLSVVILPHRAHFTYLIAAAFAPRTR